LVYTVPGGTGDWGEPDYPSRSKNKGVSLETMHPIRKKKGGKCPGLCGTRKAERRNHEEKENRRG